MTLQEHYESKKREVLIQLRDLQEDLARTARNVESDDFVAGGCLQNTHKIFRLLGELDILNELRTIEEVK